LVFHHRVFFGTDLARDPAIRVPMMMTLAFRPIPANRMQSARHRWLTIVGPGRKPDVSIAKAQAATEFCTTRRRGAIEWLGPRSRRMTRACPCDHVLLNEGNQGFAHLRDAMHNLS